MTTRRSQRRRTHLAQPTPCNPTGPTTNDLGAVTCGTCLRNIRHTIDRHEREWLADHHADAMLRAAGRYDEYHAMPTATAADRYLRGLVIAELLGQGWMYDGTREPCPHADAATNCCVPGCDHAGCHDHCR